MSDMNCGVCMHQNNTTAQVRPDLDDKVHELVLDHLLRVEIGDEEADVVTLPRKSVRTALRTIIANGNSNGNGNSSNIQRRACGGG